MEALLPSAKGIGHGRSANQVGEQTATFRISNKNCSWPIQGNPVVVKAKATSLPTLTTTAASAVTASAAVAGGNITDGGGGSVTAKGVCWSYPTILR